MTTHPCERLKGDPSEILKETDFCPNKLDDGVTFLGTTDPSEIKMEEL